MPTVSELTVVVSADTKPAEKSLSSFGESMKEGVGIGLGFGLLEKGIELVGSAFSAAKGSIIDLNSSLEQSKIAFTTMLGSAEQADAFLAQLQQFAANTPFEFPDLVNASKRMLAFGFNAQQVVPLLTAVGDASAAIGGGAETIDGVTTALGQMQAKGKVSAEEMGQLAERGIPAWDMLAKKLGVDIPTAMDMASKGAIKSSTFIEAFQEGVSERFGGMMEKQSLTFQGAMSTIMDSIQMATAKAFKPLFDLISEGAIALSKLVQTDTFSAWADGISAAVGGAVDAIRGLISIFMGASEPIEHVRDLLNGLFPPSVSAAIIGAIADLGDLFTQTFSGNIAGALDAVERILGNFGNIIAGLVESWASAFAGWVDGAQSDLIDNLGDLAIGVEGWILHAALTIIEKLGTWAAAFVDWIGPKIPDLLRELGAFLVEVAVWIVNDALPTILTKLAEWGLAFVEWVAPRIPPLLLELGKLLLELGGWIITTALPAIVSKLAEWATAFVEWVGPQILPMLAELGKLEVELGTWIITTALPSIVSKLGEWALAFVSWVGPMIPQLMIELGKLEVQLILWIGQQVVDIVKALVEWGGAFLGWIAKDVLPTLPEKLGAIVIAVGTWVNDNVRKVTDSVVALGTGIVTGIRDGISGALDGFWKWLDDNFVSKIPDFVRNLLNIHSPSGVFFDIGRQMVDGLRLGMESRLPSIDQLIGRVLGKGAAMGGAVDDWLKAAMSYTGVPDSWLEPLRWLVAHESGGDPRAKNPNSTASGLFQMIDTTWASSRDPSLPNDIWNPILNAIGGIRYIKSRYGDPFNAVDFWMRNNHYAAGGWAGLHGPELAWLGERGPEYVVPNHALRSGGGQQVVVDLRGAHIYDGQSFNKVLVRALESAERGGQIVKVTR